MNEVTEKKKWFERVKMPHTYVILITILVIMTVLTHIIPAGQYQRVEDPVSGKMIVVPGSFEFADIKAPGFFDIFLSLQRGYVDAANIMFLIIFACGSGNAGASGGQKGSAHDSDYDDCAWRFKLDPWNF